MNKEISEATQKNWEILKPDLKDKLKSRANKSLSKRTIIPTEYFVHSSNIEKIRDYIIYLKSLKEDPSTIIYNLGMAYLEEQGCFTDSFDTNENLSIALKPYVQKRIDVDKLPLTGETDPLGIIYQCLKSEGEKNLQGSYYTSSKIVRSMTGDISNKAGIRILDPAVGSGTFLYNYSYMDPEALVGIDTDKIACMISVFNFYLKYPETDLLPNIIRADFLKLTKNDVGFYDYIITNPPWGAAGKRDKEDIFSRFIRQSYKLLKDGGELRFLLPESILNVKTHSSIRDFLLNDMNLKCLKIHNDSFNGVQTGFIELRASKESIDKEFSISKSHKKYLIKKEFINQLPGKNYVCVDDVDLKIIDKAYDRETQSLKSSIWAMGIVTGDNKKKLKRSPIDGYEPITTGKEVKRYVLMPEKNYIKLKNGVFQQMAKERLYRTTPKLVYKFISDRPIFAIDFDSGLLLNSANMLIPNLEGMSIYTITAFLNSNLFAYLYKKLFGEVKILKGNLMELPFPFIDNLLDERLTDEVKSILKDKNTDNTKIDRIIYDFYRFSDEEIRQIENSVKGKK